jgi:hypothetical protein
MSIEFWIGLWKVVLIVGIGLFAMLAVVVTIGGAIDVRKLFRTLKEQHAQQQDQDESSR